MSVDGLLDEMREVIRATESKSQEMAVALSRAERVAQREGTWFLILLVLPPLPVVRCFLAYSVNFCLFNSHTFIHVISYVDM
jgi:membrane protein YqaA with SNARE-associated domain